MSCEKNGGQKGLFLIIPPFSGAGVSQSTKHGEQLLVFLELVEWSRKKYGVGGVEMFFLELEC